MLDWLATLSPIGQALVGTTFTYGVTALGAALVFFFKTIEKSVLNAMLGFAAGIMIAASFWSLLAPAIEMAEAQGQTAWLLAAAGFLAGGAFLWGVDRILPHLHIGLEKDQAEGIKTRWQRSILLVLAITLHNIPEGLAIGVSYAYGEGQFGLAVALAIAAQKIPEGSAVALPFYAHGSGRLKALKWATLSGLAQPVAAAAGFHLVAYTHGLIPFGLAAAAGAMVYVASHQLVPESHSEPGRKAPSLALLAGFLFVAILLHWLAK